ncbi:phage tail tape measure protein [Corynebacterium lactis]|uniref:Uncharacterized protein n=1 Tax=Corynebacterium lactis RW2-5 TaxID=1408189 RepID=A0A0K2H403_9CORY|nr:phage tail tape measure protein [Corynebacterium lactis]ALA68451.1 hypothetical protein CLAC_03470 [Corynebacterium lactis RW2-5]
MAGGKIDILVEPDLKGFEGKLESGLGGALGTAGKIGAALGVAIGGAEMSRQIIQVGMDFESQMNTMSAVSQATGTQLDAVAAKARELGSDTSLTATSASDAAAAMTELAKGGFTVEQSMEAAKGTLQLAAAAQIDAAEAATIQSQALQSFSLGAEDAARVSDILAGAANASSAEIGGIAQGLQQAGAVANQFGVDIDDTSTALAMFANAGIQGSDAGTLLKSALLALTDQGKPAQAAMEELGLSVYDMQGNFVGLPSLFEQLAEAQKSMTPEAYQAATATLFGSDAMRLAGIAAEQGRDGFETLRDAVTRSGQAAEVAAAQTEGLPGAMERLQNTAEEVGLAVYDALSDKLVAGADLATTALEAIGPALATGLGAALDVVGGAASALDGLEGAAIGVAGALALSSFTDFPGRMNAGTGALRGFGEQMKVQKSLAKAAGVELTSVGAAMATMEARVPTIHRMSEAYRKTGAQARAMGTLTLAASTQVDGMHRNLLLAKGSAQKFGGVLGGSVAGGLSLAKSGVTGIINALGGPWGLAIAGAGLAIGHLIQKHQEAKQAEEEHKAAQEALRESLDQTTGAITAQTRELVLKAAQESDAIDTARELGISQETLADAMTGVEGAQQKVNAAIDVGSRKALESSKAWETSGRNLRGMGITAEDVSEAIFGTGQASQDAMDKIMSKGPAAVDAFNKVASGVKDADEKFKGLRDQVNRTSDDLDKIEAEAQKDRLAALRDSTEKTKTAMELLGDSIISIPDDKSIKVESDAVNEETRAKLEELGAKVTNLPNGEVLVEFSNHLEIVSLLDSLGIKIANFKGNIEITNNSPEVEAQLEQLGLKVTDYEGHVVIDSNDEEVKQRLIELGLMAEAGVHGDLTITDNVQDVLSRKDGLTAPTKSEHTVSDNTDDVQKRKDGLKSPTDSKHDVKDNVADVNAKKETLKRPTSSQHTIYVRQVEYANSAGGTRPLPLSMQWQGGYWPGPAYALGDRHDGYRLPLTGLGTEIRDGFLALDGAGIPTARLDAGEWIINGASSATFDELLFAINNNTPRARAALAAFEELPGYAEGRDPKKRSNRKSSDPDIEASDESTDTKDEQSGVDRAFEELNPTQGGPYVYGGTLPTGADCSGYVGLWQSVLEDRNPRTTRLGTTVSLLAGQWPNLQPGTDGVFIVATNPEHMVAQLDGVNIESGGSGMQIGDGATSPYNLPNATLYYLPDEYIKGGTGSGKSKRGRSSSSKPKKTDAETERERLDKMAAESQPHLARSNVQIPPDPIVTAAMTPANDPDGVKELTKGGAWTERFGLAHNASAEDKLVEYLLWAYGQDNEPDYELARAFTEANDPTGVRSMIEAGVWTGRFGDHYRAGKDSQLVKAVLAARRNGGYFTIKLNMLEDELGDKPRSASELAGKVAKVAAEGAVSDLMQVLGQDDEFGPVVEVGLLAGKQAFTQSQGVDASGRIVIEDTTAKSSPTRQGISEAQAEEIQPAGASVYDPGRGTEQWSGLIDKALSITGNPSGWKQPMVEQGDIESHGDPSAVGPSSPEGAPAGVWQVKPGTFQAFRDPGLVDDVHDVLANGVAALNYVNSRYEKLPWPTAAGYQAGGRVTAARSGGRGPDDKIPAWLAEGEYVVSAPAARQNQAVLELINGGAEIAHLAADTVVQNGTRLATLGVDAMAGAGAIGSLGIPGIGGALAPSAESVMDIGGKAVEALSEVATQVSNRVIDTVANSATEFLVGDAQSQRREYQANMVRDAALESRAQAMREQMEQSVAAQRPVNVNANGYDRRDLAAGIRQARYEERWESGF